jgi:membrane associated rhomboid family serine protease/Zn-finger nucleic acid-binding protein
MERQPTRHGVSHACATCHGRLVGLGLLRKSIDRDAVNEVWRRAYDGLGRPARPCPVCARAMTEVAVQSDQLHIDVCTRCHQVWFDGDELDALPVASGAPEPPELSPKAQAALAFHRVQQIREQADRDAVLDGQFPDEPWKILPAVLGLPVEMHRRSLIRRAWLTWSFAGLLVLVFLLTLDHLDAVVDAWGFIPADPWRHHGVTLWTSIFLHGGWWHLIGNVYFLLLFGDDVEDHLGVPRLLQLLLLAGLLGGFVHLVGESRSSLPLIGASGAISGVVAYYTLLLPHARIGLLVRYYAFIRWAGFPAWVVLAFWICWQAVGVWMQMNGFSNVSALAHVGGMLAGLLAWFMWRDR